MAKSGVIDRDLGWEKVKAELESLRVIGVKVGIVEGHNTSEDGANIAEYAAYNEEGTEHIPSRPFIRSWVDNNHEQINKTMDAVYARVLKGQLSSEQAMKLIGEFAQSGIKKNITNGIFEPNAPATIKKKGSSRPLINTGTMRNSIRYEVTKKK